MPLIKASCSNCNAAIEIDDMQDSGICPYCGTKYIREKIVNNYNIVNNYAGATINVSGPDIDTLLKNAILLSEHEDWHNAFVAVNTAIKDAPGDFRGYETKAKIYVPYIEVLSKMTKEVSLEDLKKTINSLLRCSDTKKTLELYIPIIEQLLEYNMRNAAKECIFHAEEMAEPNNIKVEVLKFRVLISWVLSRNLDRSKWNLDSKYPDEVINQYNKLLELSQNDKAIIYDVCCKMLDFSLEWRNKIGGRGGRKDDYSVYWDGILSNFDWFILYDILLKSPCEKELIEYLFEREGRKYEIDRSKKNAQDPYSYLMLKIDVFWPQYKKYGIPLRPLPVKNRENRSFFGLFLLGYYVDKYPDMADSPGVKSIREAMDWKCKGCYIATAIYGSYDCPEVWVLRRYRDNVLDTNLFGKAFIKCYYAISPHLVRAVSKNEFVVHFLRSLLNRKVVSLKKDGISDKPYID